MKVDQETPYAFKGKHGEALKDFVVLVETGQIAKYPLFWREFATQLYEDIDDIKNELKAYKNELDAACKHVERLCEERSKLRKVVEAARKVLLPHDCDCEICIALKELAGEHE